MTNLWVDDMRRPPDGWDWAKTSAEAIAMIKTNEYEIVSLDHDLGMVDEPIDYSIMRTSAFGEVIDVLKEPYGGGYVDCTRPIVLHWIETDTWPKEIRVHSANYVGRAWLEGMIERYKPSRP